MEEISHVVQKNKVSSDKIGVGEFVWSCCCISRTPMFPVEFLFVFRVVAFLLLKKNSSNGKEKEANICCHVQLFRHLREPVMLLSSNSVTPISSGNRGVPLR